MKELVIIGAGSVGGHIAVNYKEYGLPYSLIGFLDDDPNKIGKEVFGLPVLGPVSDILEMKNLAVVIGIAFPRIKEKIIANISRNKTLEYPTIVSPKAWVSKQTNVGEGTIIYPGCSINYGSRVGNFVVMNMNCAIGHDCQLSDFSSFAPGVNLGGHTVIGRAADIGIGAATKQFITIGDNAVVGGQSMVIQNIKANVKVVGVPAKEI
ncbi:MAG: sialic acid O-acetyltransferase NeuD family sugar O-acyltransferase [Candidatus Brocadia sp. WS118]|nr:MAG: sialic acid O-acetyltransferase NeuD family sugar O-acyltransferase [Candidatus Brocadia sp. WS118]